MNASIMEAFRERLGERFDEFLIPPPVFAAMQGEFVTLDLEAGELAARFPVRHDELNPYGSMQGGMVAAAIDNALGPLSMLVAPPNVTRRLQIKYSRPVTPDLAYITVTARWTGRSGRQLSFRAEVRDPAGRLLARASASHWIVDEE
jgi:uncharacterized protein (TIGR00369 family)